MTAVLIGFALTFGESRPEAAASQQIAGLVTHVRDGDTIEVGSTAIRIAGLDCAERGTAAGDRASRAMRQLVKGKHVTCDLEGRRSYDREVGSCRLRNGVDTADILIGGGVCRPYQR